MYRFTLHEGHLVLLFLFFRGGAMVEKHLAVNVAADERDVAGD